MIYYLIAQRDWEQVSHSKAEVASPGSEGFVHCCDDGQTSHVRAMYFPADQHIVALTVDPTRLSSETRYEPGSGGESERFPHVYGPILVSDVFEANQVTIDQA